MKKLILFLLVILTISITSCTNRKESYSYEEITTLIAVGKATESDLKITIENPNNYDKYELSIIIVMDKYGYYPAFAEDATLRYYQVYNP